MGRFDTNLDMDSLNQQLLSGSLAEVKEKIREDNESHLEKIDKSNKEKKSADKQDEFKHILLGKPEIELDAVNDKTKYQAVKLHYTKEFAQIYKLSKVAKQIKIGSIIDNLIVKFVNEYKDEIDEMLEVDEKSKKLLKL